MLVCEGTRGAACHFVVVVGLVGLCVSLSPFFSHTSQPAPPPLFNSPALCARGGASLGPKSIGNTKALKKMFLQVILELLQLSATVVCCNPPPPLSHDHQGERKSDGQVYIREDGKRSRRKHRDSRLAKTRTHCDVAQNLLRTMAGIVYGGDIQFSRPTI